MNKFWGWDGKNNTVFYLGKKKTVIWEIRCSWILEDNFFPLSNCVKVETYCFPSLQGIHKQQEMHILGIQYHDKNMDPRCPLPLHLVFTYGHWFYIKAAEWTFFRKRFPSYSHRLLKCPSFVHIEIFIWKDATDQRMVIHYLELIGL